MHIRKRIVAEGYVLSGQTILSFDFYCNGEQQTANILGEYIVIWCSAKQRKAIDKMKDFLLYHAADLMGYQFKSVEIDSVF